MSSKYKFHNPEGIYFVTFAVVRWIDVFTRNLYREILLESFRYCQKEKGLKIHAWVIMTNHVHMIVSAADGCLLENIMRDLKKYTSSQVIKAIRENKIESRKEWLLKSFDEEGKKNSNNTVYQFWQQDNHPVELIDNKMMDQKLEYIHNNPVEQGFVNKAEDYPWSSIANCFHEEGLIEIELIEYTRHKSSTHKARTQDLRQLGQVLNQSLNRLKNNLKEEHKIRQKSEHI